MKRLLTSLFIIGAFVKTCFSATQIYIPSTSTYHNYVINIETGTIVQLNSSTATLTKATITNEFLTRSTATFINVSNTFVTNLATGTTITFSSGTISNFTASGSTMTRLNVQRLDPSGNSTGVAVKGTNTNTNPISGDYGEVVSSAVTTATNFPGTGTIGDLAQITITAGDWLVWAQIDAQANGATVTQISAGFSTTSGNSATGFTAGTTRLDNPPATGTTNSSVSVGPIRESLNSTTTFYLKYTSNFSVATPQAEGNIIALRIR